MFIVCGKNIININAVSAITLKDTDIIINFLNNPSYAFRYKNEDFAKNAYSKIRFGIVKGSSIVDISEDKVQNDLI